MRKADYFLLAKTLRADIRANYECLGVGIEQSKYLELRAKSDWSTSMAKYLGEHLQLTKNDRATFLELCGLRSLI